MPHLLSPTPQHYAWGGHNYLNDLLGRPSRGEPTAELWFGDHPKGPAVIPGEDKTLTELIANDPIRYLGEASIARFGERLPFLLKVLDVEKMLSIQVHPDKGTAEAGFAREEANGPDRSAPNRNYRDDNHKPELGLALSDFYLLHGFRSVEAIRETLTSVPGWSALVPHLDAEGVPGLYEYVMRADQETTDQLLQPLVDQVSSGGFDRSQPEFWAHRAVEQYSEDGHHDRGMFSIFWFNLVHLRPGQAIFQDAGIPHAYLEGRCIELMAGSDNVLRGGLTPKHIDVDELLLNTRFDTVIPDILEAHALPEGNGHYYPTPAPDFRLSQYRLTMEESVTLSGDNGPSVLLLLEGEVAVSPGELTLNKRQRAAFLGAGETVALTGGGLVFRAERG